jgi:hypothetical protein
MDSQYYYDFHEDVKSSPNHAMVVTPMDRTASNTSSASQLSNFSSSEHCFSIPTSPVSSMPHGPYEGNYLATQQHDSAYGSFQQTENVRHTPSSLGWSQGTELVKLYEFKVPKGKRPYFQLRKGWTPTYETPALVYLDESK